LKTIIIQTPPKESLLDITGQVNDLVQASGIKKGICVVFVPHTTAGLTINSYIDPATKQDISNEIRRLVPTRVDFEHTYDTPADAAGHIKSTLVGVSLTLIVTEGQLQLGGSQGLLFCEFDGPRTRKINVRVVEGG
jgi:secondary thiamine-phosphate synthase enzyme